LKTNFSGAQHYRLAAFRFGLYWKIIECLGFAVFTGILDTYVKGTGKIMSMVCIGVKG
jgi:hypothetical protein